MELRIYDPNLNRICELEEFSSLLWYRKYYEPGNFKMVLPLTERNVEYVKRGMILRNVGAKEAGVIEKVTMTDTKKKKSMTVSGRFLSSYMDRRIIVGTRTFSGTSDTVMYGFFDSVTDQIPLVEKSELPGYTDTIEKQATYKNLLDVMEALSKSTGHGFRFRPDYVEKKIYFELYDGIDRSMSQRERPRVIFSEGQSNLNEVTYSETDILYKNVFYVGGEGEGSNRRVVTIGDTSSTGLDRREVFIDARDIRRDGDPILDADGKPTGQYKPDLTDAQYDELLVERGMEKAKEYIFSQSVDSSVDPMLKYVYMRDYDLGDIVTVTKERWGISMDVRITEIMEQYAGGSCTIVPTFGDPLPGFDWSINYNE